METTDSNTSSEFLNMPDEELAELQLEHRRLCFLGEEQEELTASKQTEEHDPNDRIEGSLPPILLPEEYAQGVGPFDPTTILKPDELVLVTTEDLACLTVDDVKNAWKLRSLKNHYNGGKKDFYKFTSELRKATSNHHRGTWCSILKIARYPRRTAARNADRWDFYVTLPPALQQAADDADVDLLTTSMQNRVKTILSKSVESPMSNEEMIEALLSDEEAVSFTLKPEPAVKMVSKITEERSNTGGTDETGDDELPDGVRLIYLQYSTAEKQEFERLEIALRPVLGTNKPHETVLKALRMVNDHSPAAVIEQPVVVDDGKSSNDGTAMNSTATLADLDLEAEDAE